MTQKTNSENRNHKALYEFAHFYKSVVPVLMNNVQQLLKNIPKDIQNPVLLFLLPRAIENVVDRRILEIEQTWRILDQELRKLNEPRFNMQDPDYSDLKKIRDKTLAHRVEVLLSREKDTYINWYKKNYGSYEKILDLILKVSDKIVNEVERLMDERKLNARSSSVKVVCKIETNDIRYLIDALTEKNIY